MGQAAKSGLPQTQATKAVSKKFLINLWHIIKNEENNIYALRIFTDDQFVFKM
jgi:hypothetical protein